MDAVLLTDYKPCDWQNSLLNTKYHKEKNSKDLGWKCEWELTAGNLQYFN